MNKARLFALVASASALSLTTAGQALAQTADNSADEDKDAEDEAQPAGLREIIVTAERRSISLQDVPVSVSVRSGEDLLNQGKYSAEEILEDVPGVDMRGGSPESPGTSIVIRGILPATTPAGVSSASSTGYYVDEVYNGIGGSYDLERVEVLRGPQGTLYGRSATGGVTSFYTRDPDYAGFSINVAGETGSYSLAHATGGVNFVLVPDKVAIRVSGNHYERDGFWDDAGGYSNTDDYRVKLGFQASDDLEIILAAAGQDVKSNTGGVTIAHDVGLDDTGATVGDPTGWVINDTAVYTTYRKQSQYYGKVKWDAGFANVTYIPSFHQYTEEGLQLIGTIISQTNSTPKNDLWTHELRFDQSYDSGLSWVGGLFYYNNDETVSTTPRWQLSGALVFDQTVNRETDNVGLFGEVTFPITDSLRVTGGLRWDKTKVQSELDYTVNANTDGTNGGPTTNPSFGLPEDLQTISLTGEDGVSKYSEFTYKARLEYDLSPDNMVYAMISSGFLPGDIQATTGVNNAPIALEYAAQELVSYEIGSKNEISGALRANFSAFYYDYAGYQSTLNIGTGRAPNYIITTSPARMYGFDLEGIFEPSPMTRFTLSAGYINAKFKSFNSPIELTDAQQRSGDYIPGVTPWTVNLAAEQRFDISDDVMLTARAAGRYNSSYYTTSLTQSFVDLGALPYVQAEEGVTADASLRADFGDASITLYVRNLFDHVRKVGGTVSGAASPFTGTANLTDPRTIGLVASFNY